MSRRVSRGICLSMALAAVIAAAPAVASGDDAVKPTLSATVGIGFESGPKYAGSSSSKLELLPVLDLRYGRFFVGGEAGLGIGARLLDGGERWRISTFVQHAIVTPRNQRDDPHLNGLGDVPTTTRGGLAGTYSLGWLALGAASTWDVGGKKEGQLATAFAQFRFKISDRLSAGGGPRVTYGTSQYMQTAFGISETQSLHSGLPRYEAKSGVLSTQLDLALNYKLSEQWRLGTRARLAMLQGEAANSPITESKKQNSFGAFVSYRF
jgi:outer membrane protein